MKNTYQHRDCFTLSSNLHSRMRHSVLAITLLLGVPTLGYTEETPPDSMTTDSQQSTSGTVARAMFTSQIVDREPVDELTELANDSDRIYFFSDLRDLAGQIITHQWEHAGNKMAEVKFRVGNGPRWRVYSSKNLLPEWTGEWTVRVIDEGGSTLNVSTFTYVASSSSTNTSADQKDNQTTN